MKDHQNVLGWKELVDKRSEGCKLESLNPSFESVIYVNSGGGTISMRVLTVPLPMIQTMSTSGPCPSPEQVQVIVCLRPSRRFHAMHGSNPEPGGVV